MHRRLCLLLPVVLACGEPDTQGATQVKMLDNAFNAPVVRIPVGAGVTFTNAGRTPHNIVPVDPARWPAADTSAVAPGGKRAIALDSAGVYEFYCSYHGTKDGFGMAGAVVVGDAVYAGAKRGTLTPVAVASGTVRRVPAQHVSIQAAVDAAKPGDLILVAPGIYREEVTITTPSLVIRGLDRNTTIVDGEFIRPNGFNVLADGVALENLTARNATLNGFFWTGVTGYRGRYLTAYNNGDYGIYAFDSKDGLLEDSYASGSPDAGFYIGQCFPCNAVIRRVTSEHNAVGYSGTNAGGDLYIEQSTWRFNRGGLVPNTLDTELYPPQRSTVIRDNLIHDNNSRTAPGRGLSPLAWGNGVVLGGGRDNLVERNVILRHAGHGVMIAPLADANFWPAKGNVVRGNWIAASGRADISVGGPLSVGNRVETQENAVRTAPASLGLAAQRGTFGGEENDLTPTLALAMRIGRLRGMEYPDWRTQPIPPPQVTMQEPATAAASPAHDVFASVRRELDRDARPMASDSLYAANVDANAPMGRVPGLLATVQSYVPLTLKGLALFALLVIAQLVLAARQRGRGGSGRRHALRVVLALGVAWIGISVVVATVFSGI
jgi:plastocyanin